MNRKEAIEVLKTNRIFYRDWKQKEFEEAIETLEKEITLTEFLGWEEGKEYECGDYLYKIENEELYVNINGCNWLESLLKINRYEDLRRARQILEKPKGYHVKDEYSYDCLMQELEEQGYLWAGRDKPTSYNAKIINGLSDWNMYIYLDDYITWSLNLYPEDYEITEYHKEEPKFYAKIKSAFNLPLRSPYLFFVKHDKSIRNSKGKNHVNSYECTYFMTKSEWNKLGINDTNADFEEVE